MAQIYIGRIVPIFRGAYNSSTPYTKLDIVYYNGSSYAAIADNEGKEPTNTNYWQIVAKYGTWNDYSEGEKQQLLSRLQELQELKIEVGNRTYKDF